MQIIRLRGRYAPVCIQANESQASFLGNLLFPRTSAVGNDVIVRERLMGDDGVSRIIMSENRIVVFGHWFVRFLCGYGSRRTGDVIASSRRK